MADKSTVKLKPFTLSEYEVMLTDKKAKANLAFIHYHLRYSAAKAGIFDFPADAEFYATNLYGRDKRAKKLTLELCRKMKRKGVKVLSGEAFDKAKEIYKAEYRKWIKTRAAKEHPDYKKIRKSMRHYEEPLEPAKIKKKKISK